MILLSLIVSVPFCHEDGVGELCKLDLLFVVFLQIGTYQSGCDLLLKVTNSLYPDSHLNPTVNIESGLGLSRVFGEKIF